MLKKKRAEKLNPWATTIARAPYMAQVVLVKRSANIKPIGPTEDYAISDFTSGWRMQINLVAEASTKANLISIDDLSFTKFGRIEMIRIIP